MSHYELSRSFHVLTIMQVVKGLGGEGGGKMDCSMNTLDYPKSKFQNLRDGFPNE